MSQGEKKESKELKWNESHEQSQSYHIREAVRRKIKRRKAVGERSEVLQFTGPWGPAEGKFFPREPLEMAPSVGNFHHAGIWYE